MEDPGLLAEVAGLVEWPVVLMGSFDESFLAMPPEVIRTTIRNNQKCFVLRTSHPPLQGEGRRAAPGWGSATSTALAERGTPSRPAAPADLPPAGGGEAKAPLANKFILVANTEATDGGKAIIAGNERVIRARLSDAKFFYETDLKVKLEDRLPKFKGIIFHEKLGTQAERIERIERLAAELAPIVGADVEQAKRAARLCKADLLTEVVGEFPELQGLMGKYYALAQGEDASVAVACEDHYKPLGPNDRVPADFVSFVVALADKIDTLSAFWWINETPTGSKDPYALRRAALGVIRIILEKRLPLSLRGVVEKHFESSSWGAYSDHAENIDRLMAFLEDRLTVQLREQKARHDLVDAVLDAGSLVEGHRLISVVDRVEALGKFLDTEDGKNLLAGYKRATNIIRIEEKKDAREYVGAPDPQYYRQDEEWALARAIDAAKAEASAAVAREDFAAAMRAMAKLRPHVDAFFDKVTVNVEDKPLRENRLKLLNEIRQATRAVADFSKIEG